MEKPELSSVDVAEVSPGQRWSFWHLFKWPRWPIMSWRTTVLMGAVGGMLVLITNVVVLVWASHQTRESPGVATVFDGPCTRTKTITLWADLAINVLSTLLLSASSNCAQLIVAPTRDDIDKAHARRRWVEVGAPSVRNLGHLSWRRCLMWMLLLMSSIPLHLFYNSVVFTTLSTNDYDAFVVTEDFVKGGWWNLTRAQDTIDSIQPIDLLALQELQQNISTLIHLDKGDCIRKYTSSMSENGWRNVLVVSSLSLNDTLITMFKHAPDNKQNDEGWYCNGASDGCDISNKDLALFQIPGLSQCQLGSGVCHTWGGGSTYNCTSQINCTPVDNSEVFAAPVEYCLAEQVAPQCTIRVSLTLLIVVIVFNAVKICCLMLVALGDISPIACVGDAVASFLKRPDMLITGAGAVSYRQVQKQFHYPSVNQPLVPPAFERKSRRWAHALSGAQWGLLMTLVVAVLVAGIALLANGLKNSKSINKTAAGLWSAGVGNVDTNNLITISLGASLVENSLLANLPQIIISFVYLLYNNALTRMLLAYEYARFATVRKPLRVSRPAGQQRGSFWLQVPLRYGLPIMIAMAFLHWLTARSIFLVQLNVYDVEGNVNPSRAIEGCGYSPIAIILAICLGSCIVLWLIALSLRRLDSGMPLAGPCSVALAAACGDHGDSNDAVYGPLMYGVIGEQALGPEETLHVGFSSKEVAPLLDGVVYH